MRHDVEFPNLEQWLTHQGEIRVCSEPPGGFLAVLYPEAIHCRAATLMELFEAVELRLAEQLRKNYELQQHLITLDLAELRQDAMISVAGWPPLPNPHYRHGPLA